MCSFSTETDDSEIEETNFLRDTEFIQRHIEHFFLVFIWLKRLSKLLSFFHFYTQLNVTAKNSAHA